MWRCRRQKSLWAVTNVNGLTTEWQKKEWQPCRQARSQASRRDNLDAEHVHQLSSKTVNNLNPPQKPADQIICNLATDPYQVPIQPATQLPPGYQNWCQPGQAEMRWLPVGNPGHQLGKRDGPADKKYHQPLPKLRPTVNGLTTVWQKNGWHPAIKVGHQRDDVTTLTANPFTIG